MGTIKKWIRGKMESRSNTKKETMPPRRPLPSLSVPRPPVLTPPLTVSRESGASARLLHNYGHFGRLPYELRRQILIAAIGGKTLHISLAFGHPLVWRQITEEGAQGSNPSQHCGLGSELVPDATQPQAWQWFGCVCHRRGGYSHAEIEQREAEQRFSRTVEPCDDECLSGLMCSCEALSGTRDRSGCFIGIMGWLLSCRQAYVDGLDILYSTNTFHFSQLDLLQNLPRLLPPERLSNITSLELLWVFNIDPSTNRVNDALKPLWAEPMRQDTPLHELCAMVLKTFPNVQRLYISLQSWLDPGLGTRTLQDDVISEVESIFLGPVEQMLRLLGPGPGKEFNVAIQRGGWFVLLKKYNKLYGSKLRVESEDGLMRGRFWKSLDLSSTHHGDGSGHFGYWICCGWDDMDFIGAQDYWMMTNWGTTWTGVFDTF